MTADKKIDANPRAVLGGNTPPPSMELLQEVLHELPELLANANIGMKEKATKLVEEVAMIPEVIDDADQAGACTDIVRRIQTLQKQTETRRVETKDPFLQAGRTIDAYFKTADGWLDGLRIRARAPLKVWDDKIEAEKKRQAVEQARRAQEEADRKAKEAAEAERIAREKREAAERERAEAERKIREEAARLAAAKTADEAKAAQAALAVQQKALKTADKDIARADKDEIKAGNMLDTAVRYEATANKLATQAATGQGLGASTMSDTGTTAGGVYTWQAEITDRANLDLEALRPYLDEADLLKALNRRKAAYVTALKADKNAPAPVIRGAVFKLVKDLRVR